MKWAILAPKNGKTAQERFDLLHTYISNKFSLPKPGTSRYANPVPHPTDGTLAIPIMPVVEQYLAVAPITVTLNTTDELKALGFFPDVPTTQVFQSIQVTQVTHKGRALVYAAGAALAGFMAGLCHFYWHLF